LLHPLGKAIERWARLTFNQRTNHNGNQGKGTRQRRVRGSKAAAAAAAGKKAGAGWGHPGRRWEGWRWGYVGPTIQESTVTAECPAINGTRGKGAIRRRYGGGGAGRQAGTTRRQARGGAAGRTTPPNTGPQRGRHNPPTIIHWRAKGRGVAHSGSNARPVSPGRQAGGGKG